MDSTLKKIDGRQSPQGAMGQFHLASGRAVAMRLWKNEPPAQDKAFSSRDYETVGYVISGRATLESEGQVVTLTPGDSWLVPANAEHRYTITEAFTAVEATSPPAHAHGRDEPQ